MSASDPQATPEDEDMCRYCAGNGEHWSNDRDGPITCGYCGGTGKKEKKNADSQFPDIQKEAERLYAIGNFTDTFQPEHDRVVSISEIATALMAQRQAGIEEAMKMTLGECSDYSWSKAIEAAAMVAYKFPIMPTEVPDDEMFRYHERDVKICEAIRALAGQKREGE